MQPRPDAHCGAKPCFGCHQLHGYGTVAYRDACLSQKSVTIVAVVSSKPKASIASTCKTELVAWIVIERRIAKKLYRIIRKLSVMDAAVKELLFALQYCKGPSLRASPSQVLHMCIREFRVTLRFYISWRLNSANI